MAMIRVVLDSNVYISALLFRGKPGAVIQLVLDGRVVLITSEAIRRETEWVLAEKFHLAAEEIKRGFELLWSVSEWIEPAMVITDCSDPDDNRVLECAVGGDADVIVTGDKHLLTMDPFRGIRILRADSFLSLSEAS